MLDLEAQIGLAVENREQTFLELFDGPRQVVTQEKPAQANQKDPEPVTANTGQSSPLMLSMRLAGLTEMSTARLPSP